MIENIVEKPEQDNIYNVIRHVSSGCIALYDGKDSKFTNVSELMKDLAYGFEPKYKTFSLVTRGSGRRFYQLIGFPVFIYANEKYPDAEAIVNHISKKYGYYGYPENDFWREDGLPILLKEGLENVWSPTWIIKEAADCVCLLYVFKEPAPFSTDESRRFWKWTYEKFVDSIAEFFCEMKVGRGIGIKNSLTGCRLHRDGQKYYSKWVGKKPVHASRYRCTWIPFGTYAPLDAFKVSVEYKKSSETKISLNHNMHKLDFAWDRATFIEKNKGELVKTATFKTVAEAYANSLLLMGLNWKTMLNKMRALGVAFNVSNYAISRALNAQNELRIRGCYIKNERFFELLGLTEEKAVEMGFKIKSEDETKEYDRTYSMIYRALRKTTEESITKKLTKIQKRNQEIKIAKALRRRGVSVYRIALILGVSTRTAYRRLKEKAKVVSFKDEIAAIKRLSKKESGIKQSFPKAVWDTKSVAIFSEYTPKRKRKTGPEQLRAA